MTITHEIDGDCDNCGKNDHLTRIAFKEGWAVKEFFFCPMCLGAWNWGWACRDDEVDLLEDGVGLWQDEDDDEDDDEEDDGEEESNG